MRTGAKALLLAMALVLWHSCAMADTVPLDEIGLRYERVGSEACLTRGMGDSEAQALLGLDAQTALASMRHDDCYMLLFDGDRQLSLRVTQAPDGLDARDVSGLDAAGREALLGWLRDERVATSAEWLADQPDYALLRCEPGGDIPHGLLCMDTLYLGAVYSLRLDVLGRELTAQDEAALSDVARRTLRLGATSADSATSTDSASAEADASTLTEGSANEPAPVAAPVLTTETATLTADGSAVALALEPVAAILPTNTVTVSGTADPGCKLRIRVNDETSSSFAPESDGAFTVTGRRLRNRKENNVAVIASLDGESTTVRFSVTVDMQPTPLSVSTLSGQTADESFAVEGRTLPGATVNITRGGSKGSVKVDENGAFSFTVNTRKQGTFGFKVEASCLGYRLAELSGKVRRGADGEAEQGASYRELVRKPSQHAGAQLKLTGAVVALGYGAGTPQCLLMTEDDSAYLLYCDHLLDLSVGQAVAIDGTFTGELAAFAGDGQSYPALRSVTVAH